MDPRSNVLGHSDVLCAYVFAMVRVTRLSRAWRAPHCFHALCVLRVPKKILNLTQPPDFRLQIRPVILSVPTNSPQYVRYNRVRGNSAEHATDGPKSRKLHYGEFVGRKYVSPPSPRIKSKIPKGGFGALWRVFLPYLSSRKERYGPRSALV